MSRAQWVALATRPHVGGKTITRLLRHFGGLEAILKASRAELSRVPGLSSRVVNAILSVDVDAAEALLERIDTQGIEVLTWHDAAYPSNLLLLGDAPPALFVRGELKVSDNQAVGIVGTRQPDDRGQRAAAESAKQFAEREWTVVSGLALGIDTAAHQGALAAGGRTLAVLGSGVNQVYPRRNTVLAERIAKQGAVISELHPEQDVSRQQLIARNRITAGLCRALIVVQSSADSGTVNTARRALKVGRKVYAVISQGEQADHLLNEGAVPLQLENVDWDDLCEQMASEPLQRQPDDGDSQQLSLF